MPSLSIQSKQEVMPGWLPEATGGQGAFTTPPVVRTPAKLLSAGAIQAHKAVQQFMPAEPRAGRSLTTSPPISSLSFLPAANLEQQGQQLLPEATPVAVLAEDVTAGRSRC